MGLEYLKAVRVKAGRHSKMPGLPTLIELAIPFFAADFGKSRRRALAGEGGSCGALAGGGGSCGGGGTAIAAGAVFQSSRQISRVSRGSKEQKDQQEHKLSRRRSSSSSNITSSSSSSSRSSS